MSRSALVVTLLLAVAAAPAFGGPHEAAMRATERRAMERRAAERPETTVATGAASAATTAVAAGTGSQAPDVAIPLPPELRRILDHASLRDARVGILVISVPDGEVLVRHRADELFAPASVAKLFTTAAALWRLGPHFTWRTPLAYRGTYRDDTIDGDLWVLGRGAPDLVEEKLWMVARALRDQGLSRIHGDIVVEDRYFDDVRYGEGWPGGRQVREAYHAPISALMANYAAQRGNDGWDAVEDPPLHFGERLWARLQELGIDVGGAIRRPTVEELEAVPAPTEAGAELGSASVPAALEHLYTIRSEPLGRLVMDVNKFSNNVMAESLLKALGAIEYGPPGTTTKGLAVVSEFLDEIGIPLTSYVQADGSGLSRLDRFSPDQVVQLLMHASSDFHIGPELLASLKLGGLDGWNPAAFRNPPLVGELRVKSGHIRGVNTLAGLLHTSSGRSVIFCAMVNEHRVGQWEVDQRMAEIADVMIRTY